MSSLDIQSNSDHLTEKGITTIKHFMMHKNYLCTLLLSKNQFSLVWEKYMTEGIVVCKWAFIQMPSENNKISIFKII